MSAARRRNRRDRLVQSMGSAPEPRRRGWFIPFLVGVAATAAVFLATRSARTNSNHVGSAALAAASLGPDRPTLAALTAMSDDELTGHDIGLINLRCAEGLPGSETLDITASLRKLNEWTQRVRVETERHLYRAHDPQYAKHYRNSEAFLRASMMVQVLQEDCGVHYNHERIREIDFTKSQDLFIHGMIGRANGGTCVSMPVL